MLFRVSESCFERFRGCDEGCVCLRPESHSIVLAVFLSFFLWLVLQVTITVILWAVGLD